SRPGRRPKRCTKPAAASKSPSAWATAKGEETMHDPKHEPSDRPARDELSGPLRAALEHVDAQPLPLGAIAHPTEQAKRLEGPRMKQSRKYGWRQYAMAAAVIAAACVPILLAALIPNVPAEQTNVADQWVIADEFRFEDPQVRTYVMPNGERFTLPEG